METSHFLGFRLERGSWDYAYVEVYVDGKKEPLESFYGITSPLRAKLWCVFHFWRAW